jgi:hypothetical protein
MTIEELLECDAETLEKMTDEQLKEFFAPYLVWVKPGDGPKQGNLKLDAASAGAKKVKGATLYNANLEKARELAKKLGINFDE